MTYYYTIFCKTRVSLDSVYTGLVSFTVSSYMNMCPHFNSIFDSLRHCEIISDVQ